MTDDTTCVSFFLAISWLLSSFSVVSLFAVTCHLNCTAYTGVCMTIYDYLYKSLATVSKIARYHLLTSRAMHYLQCLENIMFINADGMWPNQAVYSLYSMIWLSILESELSPFSDKGLRSM